jgi:hypothetical protein
MRRKLALGLAALAVIVAGLAALSAFTAQIVNIQAHAEKDIALEPIICTAQSDFGGDYNEPCYVDPNGGDYGVTLPQEFYDKEIELTLSNSFFEQRKFFDIIFAMLWECKQAVDADGDEVDADGDTIGDCRVDLPNDDVCLIDLGTDGRADTIQHCDPQKLDGSIREHIAITTKGGESRRCQQDRFELQPRASQVLAWEKKNIEWQFSGVISKGAPKCRYELKFFSPPCITGFNPYTDPHPLTDEKQPVDCHKADKMRHVGYDDDGDGPMDEDPLDGIDNDGDGLVDEDPGAESVNPQDIDEFADLGDDFKIQVIEHSQR